MGTNYAIYDASMAMPAIVLGELVPKDSEQLGPLGLNEDCNEVGRDKEPSFFGVSNTLETALAMMEQRWRG